MVNVLSARYASEAMNEVWSPERKVVLERELWIAVMQAQQRLGVADGRVPLRVDERVQRGRVRFEFTSRRSRPDARPQRGEALVDAPPQVDRGRRDVLGGHYTSNLRAGALRGDARDERTNYPD